MCGRARYRRRGAHRIELLGRFHAERHWGEISRQLNGGGTVRDPHAACARLVAAPVDLNVMDQRLRRRGAPPDRPC
jgi:hypothetical protein